MSLLVTSCTMGQEPNRLLNKGPQYLRTRTNASLFGEHRKSAVELLAASKAQFYSIKSPVSLNTHQDLAVSVGLHERYSKNSNSSKQKQPVRSKSQYDLSLSQLATTEDGSDENNNDTSDDSITFSKTVFLEKANSLSLKEDIALQQYRIFEGAKQSPSVVSSSVSEETLNIAPAVPAIEKSAVNHSLKPQPRLTYLRSASLTVYENYQICRNITGEGKLLDGRDEADGMTVKKPVPLPRKSKEKPVPPPRKHSVTSVHNTATSSDLSLREAVSSPVALHNLSVSNKQLIQETAKLKTQASSTSPETDVRKKSSNVESLTKRFTALSATSALTKLEAFLQQPKTEKSPEIKAKTEISGTFTATPIFIGKPEINSPQIFQDKQPFLEDCITPLAGRIAETSYVDSDSTAINKNRKRCPDICASARSVKRERRSIGSDTSFSKPGVVNSLSKFVPLERSISSPTPKSKMSIESVDQAVYDSEINAIPTTSMETDNSVGKGEGVREITRSNSSLSGKMDPQGISPSSTSPTSRCSLVPRSLSDIGCSLESQHSREAPLLSNHSRLSRASIGAELEHFFNQMGLEKGVLEPMNRLREQPAGDIFDSMSSLGSQDAASICSTFSRSEQEWSDSQPVDRSQQQTSIVERNARIIKWLCNVKKAKHHLQKSESTATGKA